MLKSWAKILPLFLIKWSYRALCGEALWEIERALKGEDWRAYWLDDETILLIKK